MTQYLIKQFITRIYQLVNLASLLFFFWEIENQERKRETLRKSSEFLGRYCLEIVSGLKNRFLVSS